MADRSGDCTVRMVAKMSVPQLNIRKGDRLTIVGERVYLTRTFMASDLKGYRARLQTE